MRTPLWDGRHRRQGRLRDARQLRCAILGMDALVHGAPEEWTRGAEPLAVDGRAYARSALARPALRRVLVRAKDERQLGDLQVYRRIVAGMLRGCGVAARQHVLPGPVRLVSGCCSDRLQLLDPRRCLGASPPVGFPAETNASLEVLGKMRFTQPGQCLHIRRGGSFCVYKGVLLYFHVFRLADDQRQA